MRGYRPGCYFHFTYVLTFSLSHFFLLAYLRTYFLTQARGSALERAVGALRARGTAVLNAAISTGLSVLLLAFADSAIFTTFFWLLLGVVLVGLFHALLVLPSCLSLL